MLIHILFMHFSENLFYFPLLLGYICEEKTIKVAPLLPLLPFQFVC